MYLGVYQSISRKHSVSKGYSIVLTASKSFTFGKRVSCFLAARSVHSTKQKLWKGDEIFINFSYSNNRSQLPELARGKML